MRNLHDKVLPPPQPGWRNYQHDLHDKAALFQGRYDARGRFKAQNNEPGNESLMDLAESVGTSKPSNMGSPKRRKRTFILPYELACSERCIVPKFARAARDGINGEDLDFSGLGLGDDQLLALLCDSDLVPSSKILRWSVKDNRMSCSGCVGLAAKLNPRMLEILDITHNHVGMKGMEAFRRLMCYSSMENFRSINVSANDLRDEAMAALCEGLRVCPALISLDASQNKIQGGAPLGRLCAEHPKLTRLALHSNMLCGRGADALFQGMLQNVH